MADKKDPKAKTPPASIQMAGHPPRTRGSGDGSAPPEDPTNVPEFDDFRPKKLEADLKDQQRMVDRWLRSCELPNPVSVLPPGRSAEDVCNALAYLCPNSSGRHQGLVTRVLLGEAVDPDELVHAMVELGRQARVRALRLRSDGFTPDEDDVAAMTRFWEKVPEISPPEDGWVFRNWNHAFDAAALAFPYLIEEYRDMLGQLAYGLYGGLQNHDFAVFRDLVDQIRLTNRLKEEDKEREEMITLTDADDAPDEEAVAATVSLELDDHEETTLEQIDVVDPVFIDDDEDPFVHPGDEVWFIDDEDDTGDVVEQAGDRDVSHVEFVPIEEQEAHEPDGPRWLIGVILLVVILCVIALAWWKMGGFLDFSRLVLEHESYDTHTPDMLAEQEDAPVTEIVTPEPQKVATIPLACTNYQMLHTPNMGPAPEGCYVVGCSQGYPALRSYTPETGWLACTKDQVIPKRGDCYLVENKDNSVRSVAFHDGSWIDEDCL